MEHRSASSAASWLARLSLLLISFLISAALAETALRFWSTPRRVDSRSPAGLSWESWPDFWSFRPGVSTIVVTPSAEAATRYEINSWGMRDRPRHRQPTAGVERIVFVGDSFTEGFGVELPEAFPSRVEALAGGRIEAVNSGMRGMSPAAAYFRLKRLMESGFEFDTVVLQVFDNDFNDDRLYEEGRQLAYDEASGGLLRASFVDSHPVFRRFEPFGWRASRILLVRLSAGLESHLPLDAQVHRRPREMAETAYELYRKYGITTVALEPVSARESELVFSRLPQRILPAEGLDELWNALRPFLVASDGREVHQTGPVPVSELTRRNLDAIAHLKTKPFMLMNVWN